MSSFDFGTRHLRRARGKWGAEQSRSATGQTEIPGAGLVRAATSFSLRDRSHVLGRREHALRLSGLRWRTRGRVPLILAGEARWLANQAQHF